MNRITLCSLTGGWLPLWLGIMAGIGVLWLPHPATGSETFISILTESGVPDADARALSDDIALEEDEILVSSVPGISREILGVDRFGKSVAVVVGVSDYGPSTSGRRIWDDIKASEPNARRMRDYLAGPGGFDIVITLREKRAAKRRISLLMEDVLPRILGRNDRLLFYFSGHGDQEVQRSRNRKLGYLVLAESEDRRADMISMREMMEEWAPRLQSVRHLLFIIDSCFSGLVGVQSPSQSRRLDTGEVSLRTLSRKAHHVITAGTEDQLTYAAARFNGSVFTDGLLTGVKGPADENADRIVTIDELMDFVRKRVQEVSPEVDWYRPITPSIRGLSGVNNKGRFYFRYTRPQPLACGETDPDTGRRKVCIPPCEADSPVAPAGPAFSDPVDGEVVDWTPVMVPLATGSYCMGSPQNAGFPAKEQPARKVSIDAPFAIGKFEVTVAQWRVCMTDAERCRPLQGIEDAAADLPVTNVTWDDAVAFAAWLSEKTGYPYRLPTEAEWEFAARAATTTRYAWGDDEPACEPSDPRGANFKPCNRRAPSPIGRFPANPFGLHDMHGNVYEWTLDCSHGNYWYAPPDAKTPWRNENIGNCNFAMVRGGSWNRFPDDLRSGARYEHRRSLGSGELGFRLVREPAP